MKVLEAAQRYGITEALALLRSAGASTRMTQSTRAMLQEITKMGLREGFGAREPERIAPVLDAIVEIRRAKRD